MFPKPISWLGMEKLNLTDIHQSKEMYYHTKNKETKAMLVASYDIRHGNRHSGFSASLTYLNTYPLTYSPGTHMRLQFTWITVFYLAVMKAEKKHQVPVITMVTCCKSQSTKQYLLLTTTDILWAFHCRIYNCRNGTK